MLFTKLIVIIAVLGIILCAKERKRYDKYQLVELRPRTELQTKILQKLKDRHQGGLLFAEEVIKVGSSFEVLVAPYIKDVFWKTMVRSDIEIDVKKHDIQTFYDKEFERLDAKINYDPNDYNSYEQIQEELIRLTSVCPVDFECEIETIGMSIYEKEINIIKISQPLLNKEVIWIDSLIHAREWIAGTSVMKTAAMLIEEYGSNEDATYLMDQYDFVILPVFNPDGYIHSWESDRLWRKNRRVNEGSNCIGVDLNRNHGFHWGEQPGSDDNPCSDGYHGPSVASEPETQAVESALLQLADQKTIAMFMTVHTAAEMWLMPYGIEENDQCVFASDHDDLQKVSDAAVAAVKDTHGDDWDAGSTCDVLYAATGITQDFAYGVANIKYSFTPELHGPRFGPEPDKIQPAFEEWFAGLVAAIKERELIETKSK